MDNKQCKCCKKWIPTEFILLKGKGKWRTNGKYWNGNTCPTCIKQNQLEKKEAKRHFNPLVFHNCQLCDTVFYTKTKRSSKFCSASCRTKEFNQRTGYYTNYKRKSRKKDKIYTRNCLKCNTKFTSNTPKKVYCSNDCRITKDRPTLVPINCNHCQKKFLPKSSHQKYCSTGCSKPTIIKTCKTCNVRIKRGKYCPSHKPVYQKQVYTLTCNTCDKDFTTNKPQVQYCGRKCQPSYRERKKLSKRQMTIAKLKCVSWREIAEFKATRPTSNHCLDHIIPLNSPHVCGLHVPWNFQWLRRSVNNFKSNKFDGTYENEGWRKNFQKKK